MNKYKCEKCGCEKLSYQKYVKCLSDVDIDENGQIHYGQSIIDEDNYVGAEFGYVCGSCGSRLSHGFNWLETEEELIQYLTTAPEVLAEQQRQFDEYLAEECEMQAQKDKERAEYYTIF
jgi:hypothetical protein